MATGRGGAGNFALASQTSTDPAPQPTSSSPQSKQPVHTTPGTAIDSTIPPYRGRGGAGNFQAYSAEQQAAVQREEKARLQKESEVRKAVEEDVEMGLQKPAGAWIEVPEGRERE